MVGIDGEKAPSLGRGAGGCGAGGLPWAAGRRSAGARGTGNQFNWAEREAAPHPRAGARRGDTGDAGLVGSGLARLPAPVFAPLPCTPAGHRGSLSLRASREAFAASGASNGHCRRSSSYFSSRRAPPSFGNASCSLSFLRLTNNQSPP